MSRSSTVFVAAAMIATLVVAGGLTAAGNGTSIRPAILEYVESTVGLRPPTMEGGSTEIEMGDVDGDGHLDLVSIGDHGSPLVGTDQHGLMVWFGDGEGTWSVEMTGHFGYGGVALGDVDGDGVMDVGYGMHHNYSATDLGDQLLEVALGDGSGLDWAPWDDGLAGNGETWGMFSTDLADVDADGDLDLGAGPFGCCAGVHVYLNRGDGSWGQSFGFLGGNSRTGFVFGEINGDGAVDFAVGHGAATVYLGDGTGDFTAADANLPQGDSQGRVGVDLGDVDGDGADELSFCNDSGGIEVWTLTTAGIWESLSGDLPTTGTCQATRLFDMNVDGSLDLVSFGFGEGVIWGGDGNGGWAPIASFGTPPSGGVEALRVGGDADHNGFPDMVLVAEEGVWPSLQNVMHIFSEASAPTSTTITPMWPRGSETIRAGSVVFVDWISAVASPDRGIVTLELSIEGPDGPWQLLADDLPNNGRYQWRVPATTSRTDTATIRFTLSSGGVTTSAVTPAPFAVIGGPSSSDSRVRHDEPSRRRVPEQP